MLSQIHFCATAFAWAGFFPFFQHFGNSVFGISPDKPPRQARLALGHGSSIKCALNGLDRFAYKFVLHIYPLILVAFPFLAAEDFFVHFFVAFGHAVDSEIFLDVFSTVSTVDLVDFRHSLDGFIDSID